MKKGDRVMKYFVSFASWRDNGVPVFGNCMYETKGKTKITSQKSIRAIEKGIEKEFGLEELTILFWRRYDTTKS